jgi:hypothetical protein
MCWGYVREAENKFLHVMMSEKVIVKTFALECRH